jgi:hypothetical protein
MTGGVIHVPPLLAVEAAGRYQSEPSLHARTHWYLTGRRAGRGYARPSVSGGRSRSATTATGDTPRSPHGRP